MASLSWGRASSVPRRSVAVSTARAVSLPGPRDPEASAARAMRSASSVKVLPRSLSRLQRAGVLLGAFVAVIAVRITLWLLPSGRIVRTVRCLSARQPANAVGAPTPRRILVAVRRVSGFVPGASCLTQAVAGQILLRRYGHASTLRLGVRAGARGFAAHAWIEQDGRPVLGAAETRGMTPLPDLVAHAATGSD